MPASNPGRARWNVKTRYITDKKLKRTPGILLSFFVRNIAFSNIPADTTRIRGRPMPPSNSSRINGNARKRNMTDKKIKELIDLF